MALRILVALGLALAGPAAACDAQGYPFSQRGTVSQDIAFTKVSVSCGRPVARGRTLFGQLVPWDAVWHPGADSATIIAFNRDVLVEGQPVKAGEYSLWLLPRDQRPWTVILSRAAHVFHTPYPGVGQDALRRRLTAACLASRDDGDLLPRRGARFGADAHSLGRDERRRSYQRAISA